MKKILLITVILFRSLISFAQIGPNEANSLMGLPRATDLTELNNVISPQTGSMAYNNNDNKVYIYDGTNWVSTSNDNWLIDGNNGLASSSFLGHIDDVKMEIRSNNLPLLQFGRRETLGLTQTFADYTDDDQPLVYVNGDGVTSALQFAASAANFYKPMFFTTTNGSFRLKGSCGGTDFFEIGSGGPSNQGRLEFIIGDDGNEPIIFKRFDYRNGQFHKEFFRVQGSSQTAGAKTRFGININAFETPLDTNYSQNQNGNSGTEAFVIANSTLQLEGSLSLSVLTTTGNLTLTEDHHTIIINGNHDISLPIANTCEGREYILKNQTGSAITISSYQDLSNASQTSITANTAITIQSDGSNWHLISVLGGSGTTNTPRLFEAYDNVGGITANETAGNYTILNLDTERTNIGGFTLTNDTVTIPEDGVYEVGYTVTFTANTNNNSRVETIVFLNNVEINGTSAYVTLDNNGDEYTASKSIIISLSINDELLIASNRAGSTNGSATTVVDATNITIKKLN